MEDRYSGLKIPTRPCKYSKCISKVHQPTKPHGLVGQFPNTQKVNKEAYDYIDYFPNKLKEYICEPIATRYVRDITGVTIRYDNDKKVFLPHHTSKHQHYAQWGFEGGSIVTKKNLCITSYTTSDEY